MAGAMDFSGMVPGFEFLQGLMKNAGAGLPGMGQWVAPTLDPAEIEKRIGELRTVQFWLEQNARLLATTIQALEVQRMTLATLQTMNLPMADLRDSLKIEVPKPAPVPAPAPAPAPASTAPAPAPKVAAAPSAAPAVDPLQWWGALTQQFTELAAQALKDTAAAAAAAPHAAAAKRPGGAPASQTADAKTSKGVSKTTPTAASRAAPRRRAG